VEVIYRILAQTFNNPAAPPPGSGAFEYPVVFNTYQMYLRRTSHVLEEDLRIAQEQGLVLAVKLVRGAYMKSELRRNVSSSDRDEVTVRPLIHSQLLMTSKQRTDEAYDTAAAKLIDIIGRDNSDHHDDKSIPDAGGSTVHRIPAVALLLATHNKESVARAIDRMAECRIGPSNPFVQFAQIRGMSDHVTLSLASHQYRVSKLLLFGSFTDVLPWLLRRLDENQVRE
jgi:proline dehydrogenase